LDDAVEIIHGTVIALGSHAALIRGAPGSGKSDLALRCLAMGPTALIPSPPVLVADDRVQVSCAGGHLKAEAPATIRGKLEVRGLGIMTVPCLAGAELVLVAELTTPERIERFPDPPPTTDLMGVHLPLLYLAPFEAAAHVKLLLALVATFKRAPIVV
jgi:serine kinase of HPr protein (carbohydrate metabolism regulator)